MYVAADLPSRGGGLAALSNRRREPAYSSMLGTHSSHRAPTTLPSHWEKNTWSLATLDFLKKTLKLSQLMGQPMEFFQKLSRTPGRLLIGLRQEELLPTGQCGQDAASSGRTSRCGLPLASGEEGEVSCHTFSP